MAGQILGDRYEVEQQLGKQASRWTLLARDLVTQSPVVLNLLFMDEQMGADDLKLFAREIDTLKALSHPAIPQYLRYFELRLPQAGRALALVQTYIAGQSLAQQIAAGHRFDEPEAKHVAREVLDILNYLHHCQPPIIHRDIKPGNLRLNQERVYLVDFASVKAFVTDDNAYTLVGTSDYIPPEQLGGRAVIASDLYSLGITLMTGLTGLEPNKLPRQGIRIDIQAAVSVSSAFANWLSWMTELSLDKRVKSAQEALTALEAN